MIVLAKLASVYADHAPINRRILQRLNAPITPLIKNPCLPSKKPAFNKYIFTKQPSACVIPCQSVAFFSFAWRWSAQAFA